MHRLFLLVLLPLGVLSQRVEWGERPDPVGSGVGECVYTFTVPAGAMRDSCRTSEVETLVKRMQSDYDQAQLENKELRDEIKSLRADYESMVDTVKVLKKETSSWREIIEWPKVELPLEPDNVSLIRLSEPSFIDCWEANRRGHSKKGIYSLQPEDAAVPFFGFCDQGGWTVFQRRFDGAVDFYRGWDEYSRGFGQLSGEFWLGLDNLFQLTSQKSYLLRVEVVGYNGKLYTSDYPNFKVHDEFENYALELGNMSAGNYKDVFSDHNGLGFSTFDRDNDDWYSSNCAHYYRGAFWLTSCGFDLNREWCDGGGCMTWGDRVIKKSVMKIRPMEAGGEGRVRIAKKPRAGGKRRHRGRPKNE